MQTAAYSPKEQMNTQRTCPQTEPMETEVGNPVISITKDSGYSRLHPYLIDLSIV